MLCPHESQDYMIRSRSSILYTIGTLGWNCTSRGGLENRSFIYLTDEGLQE